MDQKRIAVIGAGPSGLTAIKACKEENVEAVCFERNGEPGGLWRYHDEDIEGVASVMKTTIINTSKEMSAFSDFPPPKEFPNYMHNTMMFKYFMLYAKNFDLLKHIRYHQEVIKVEKAEDYEETGCWTVTTKDTKTGDVTRENFHGVMVCIGHHVYPKIPTFPGQEKFKGKIMHSHSLKNCQQFSGMNVVVVGIGNSGVDAAVDSTFVANQVFLSTRRGCWIMGRVGPEGRPFDTDFITRFNNFASNLQSFDRVCTKVENALNKKFDHEKYNLKPKHRVLSAHPTMNDSLPNCILSGRVVVKGNIERFHENGVLFEGDSEITKADAVVFATGYNIKFPFISDDIVTTKDNRSYLYKYALPHGLKHQTLALIGLVQPIGPIFPIAEMHCRWFMQIFKGNMKLLSREVMEEDIRRKNEANAKRYVDSTRHTIQVDFVPFLDELAEQFGAKPNLWKLALTDPQLFWTCLFGPSLSYQYRLQGPHKWEGARDALLTTEERIYAPLSTRIRDVKAPKRTMVNFIGLFWLLWPVILLSAVILKCMW